MTLGRFREQDGLMREAMWIFLVVAVIAVIILDSFGVFSAGQNVRSDAHDAALAANHAYVQSGSISYAEQQARNLLNSNGDRPVKVTTKVDLSIGPDPIFIVTARRTASTYVFKYAVHLPVVGKSIDKLLTQSATRDSSQ